MTFEVCKRKDFSTISTLSDKTDNSDTLNGLHKAKRGRPRKDIDTGIIIHMLKNRATIAAVAKHLGIHRDTLYENYRSVIEEGLASHREAWRKISDEMLTRFLEEKGSKRQPKENEGAIAGDSKMERIFFRQLPVIRSTLGLKKKVYKVFHKSTYTHR